MAGVGELTPEPDFSDLPTVVWVNILDHVNLVTRYRVSVTCSKLNEAFNHPTLWRKMTLHVTGNVTNYGWSKQMVVPARNIQLVRHFGKYVQNLSILISGYLDDDFGDWNDLITEVANKCRLETLALSVGTPTTAYHYIGNKSCRRNLIPLVNFIQKAFRLKKLHVMSWPMDNEDENIFEAAVSNPKLKDLEELSLFCATEKDWTSRQPVLPSPTETTYLVNHFCHLRNLSLRSPMINSELLTTLSVKGRAPLRRLQVLVKYIGQEDEFQIPEVSDRVWEEFTRKNLGVQVVLTILTRVPLHELSNFLKPSCPVHAVTFMSFSDCDSNMVLYLTERYGHTLACFECYGEEVDLGNELVSLVEKSPKLDKLLYYGKICSRNVERLAELRSKHWETFIILRDNIYVESEKNIDDMFDEDQVFTETEEGTLVLVSVRKRILREEEKQTAIVRLREMAENVSKQLGYHWMPTVKKPKFSFT